MTGADSRKIEKIDEDINFDIDIINELYEMIRSIEKTREQEGSFNKATLLEAYYGLSGTGAYDKMLEKLNGIYGKIGSKDNKLLLEASMLTGFYERIEDEADILTAVMEIGNRISKIPGEIIKGESETGRWQDGYTKKCNIYIGIMCKEIGMY